jgi:hypothetical protein
MLEPFCRPLNEDETLMKLLLVSSIRSRVHCTGSLWLCCVGGPAGAGLPRFAACGLVFIVASASTSAAA